MTSFLARELVNVIANHPTYEVYKGVSITHEALLAAHGSVSTPLKALAEDVKQELQGRGMFNDVRIYVDPKTRDTTRELLVTWGPGEGKVYV